MAIFRCYNCGLLFVADVKEHSALQFVKCPKCGSDWIKYVRPGLEVFGSSGLELRRAGGDGE